MTEFAATLCPVCLGSGVTDYRTENSSSRQASGETAQRAGDHANCRIQPADRGVMMRHRRLLQYDFEDGSCVAVSIWGDVATAEALDILEEMIARKRRELAMLEERANDRP